MDVCKAKNTRRRTVRLFQNLKAPPFALLPFVSLLYLADSECDVIRQWKTLQLSMHHPQPCKMSDGTASSLTLGGKEVNKEEDSTSISTPVEINVELIQTWDSENLTIQQQLVTVVEAKQRFVQWLNKAYGIQPFQFDEALINIIPYVPLGVLSYKGVTILTPMSQCIYWQSLSTIHNLLFRLPCSTKSASN